MPAAEELVAHNRSVEEIRKEIGVDRLIYQDLQDLKNAIIKGNPELTTFEDSVFTGNYITGVPTEYLETLAKRRSDKAKSADKITDLDGDDYNVF